MNLPTNNMKCDSMFRYTWYQYGSISVPVDILPQFSQLIFNEHKIRVLRTIVVQPNLTERLDDWNPCAKLGHRVDIL